MDRMGDARMCVLCGQHPVNERWQPFCSERCRNEDLARWADGRYRVSGDPVRSPDSDVDAEPDS